MNRGQQDELAQLRHLATAHNVQTTYHDLAGQLVEAPQDSVVAALRAMGVIADLRDAGDALERYMSETWQWHIEPVIVAWEGVVPQFRLRLPASAADADAACAIGYEDGGTQEWHLSLEDLPTAEVGEAGGVQCTGLDITIEGSLPFGYHRFAMEVLGHRLESLIISAPRKSYRRAGGRNWGLFLPLYALHSERSWGIGDYTDLRRLIDWAGDKGAGFVATLPLLATFLDRPYDHSPYAPVSRLFWNEVFIDTEAPISGSGVPPVEAESAAKARLLSSFAEVPFRAVMGLKRHALELQSALESVNQDLVRFLDTKPIVRDYAAFRAALEHLGPSWREWPEEQRRGTLTPQDYDSSVAQYHAFAEWRASLQMKDASDAARERGMSLYLDLPIGVHPSGYDAWRCQGLFAHGISVGAPPDLLAPDGQNWGFEPMKPAALRRAGYDYLVAYLRHHLSVAGMLRVDHAIGLHRLFWIPEGASGRDGLFVRQPFDELYAILSLESHRYEALIVGEDLGLVPPEVREGLAEHGIAGMYVQMFNLTGDPEAPVTPPRPESVASFATHDLPAFAAYWTGDDLAQRERLGLMTPERARGEDGKRRELKEALLAHLQARGLVSESPEPAEVFRGALTLLAESEADHVMVALEDAWGATQPQNIPGSTQEQYPNWTSRADHSFEDFDSLASLTTTLEALRRARDSRTAVPAVPADQGGSI